LGSSRVQSPVHFPSGYASYFEMATINSSLKRKPQMPITSLPVELISEVCSYLQLSELQALRLTCRNLYQVSLDAFSDRYFRSIRFLATNGGLRDLEYQPSLMAPTEGTETHCTTTPCHQKAAKNCRVLSLKLAMPYIELRSKIIALSLGLKHSALDFANAWNVFTKT
jgi:hypothetical protein